MAVVLDRPAKKGVDCKRIDALDVPLPRRLVFGWVLGEEGEVLAEWNLFTNAGAKHDADTVTLW